MAGFQNPDVGKTAFNNDYGPDFGPDYARYADPPDLGADARLFEQVREALIEEDMEHLEVIVRNGFIIIKGHVPDIETKNSIKHKLAMINGVRDIITQLI